MKGKKKEKTLSDYNRNRKNLEKVFDDFFDEAYVYLDVLGFLEDSE